MKRSLSLLILLLMVWVSQAQNGYWEEAKAPYGGYAGIIPTQTNVVYAQHANAIHRSDDYGEHWQRIFVTEVDSTDYGEEELVLGSMGTFYKIVAYFDGNSLIRKLFASSDEGQTWVLKNNEMPVISLFETPSGALIGFDYGFDSRIFRSTDQGGSWQFIYQTTSSYLEANSTRHSLTPDGKIMLSNSSLNGLVYSDDDGLSWTESDNPGIFSNAYLTAAGTILIVNELINESDLYRSTNLGSTWDTIGFDLGPNGKLGTITNLSNGKLLLSSNSDLYISADEGLTWDLLPKSIEQARSFSLNHPLHNGDILASRNGALYRSSDEGLHWAFSAYGMKNARVDAIKPFTETRQLALTETGLWKTADGGETWNRILADTTTDILYSTHRLAVVKENRFAVTMGNQIWATTNGGQQFSNLTPPGNLSRDNIFAVSGGQLFCTGNTGVLSKNSFGEIWSLSIPDAALNAVVEHPSGDLYALTSPLDYSSQNQTLWRSQNAGLSWEEITSLAIEPINRLEILVGIDGRIYASGYYDHSMKVAISTDGANTWSYKPIPDNNTFGELVVNDLGQIFTTVFSPFSAILTSVDDGESWYYLPTIPDQSFSISGHELSGEGNLYLTSYDGILYRSKKSTEEGAYIRGQVAKDADQDCSTPDAQEPLKNWTVQLKGAEAFYATTNASGRYTFFIDTGNYVARALVPQNLWWTLCDSAQAVQATDWMNADTVDFAVLTLSECPLMTVNVAIPRLRRCFDNSVYIQYCNQGTETADSAWVDVILDSYLSFVSSAQAHTTLPNNTIRFFVGDIPSGDCGQFQLIVHVDCDSTIIGQTHCISAHGFPDTLCTPVPNWSGANITARATCQDSVLQFTLENNGIAPSQTLDYIIIEDDVVLFTGQKNYNTGESFTLDYPANGSTWRIESEQEPGHPFSNLALAFAEGCGGFGSAGFINQFSVNGIEPSWHRVCLENTGAYDPNDKQGYPLGFGPEHTIYAGESLDYLIRFQNTGTDTAFNIVVRDTLSALLDPASIRPGASSHPYTWSLSGAGIITFNFYNIMLPDSNVNEATSHGFIQFHISPNRNTPPGSTIENKAAIYFDFNAPIFTNSTWHTIEKSPLKSGLLPVPKSPEFGLNISPNPFNAYTNIQLEKKNSGAMLLKIFDSRGILVFQKTTTGSEIELRAPELPSGLYMAELRDAKGKLIGSSKMLKQ